MFASIRKYHVDAGSVDELLREVQASLVPALAKVPGYQGHYEIVSEDGSVVSITGVRERGELAALNEAAERWAHEHMRRFKAQRLEVSEGEIRVMDRSGAAMGRSGR